MDGRMDGWMDGRTDRRMDGCTDVRMDGWITLVTRNSYALPLIAITYFVCKWHLYSADGERYTSKYSLVFPHFSYDALDCPNMDDRWKFFRGQCHGPNEGVYN